MKDVIVTGGSQGLGLELVRNCLKKGYRVYGYVTNQKLTDPNFVREILRK